MAEVFGIKLRGVIAWVFWRAGYLSKVPGFDRKVRIAVDWTLDFILPRDITQLRIFGSAGVQHQHFHAGEQIFGAGDVGDQLYVIVDGSVEVVSDGTTVAKLIKGEVFGEIALVSHRPRNAQVIAITDVDLIAIPRDDFHELVTHLPGVKPAINEIMRSHGVDISG